MTIKLINISHDRGGSRIFFRRGCTRLLRYFNTNTPHSFFFFFCRIPVVLENQRGISGGGRVCTPCTLPLDPPLHEVQGSWFHTGSYRQLRCEWFKVVNFLLSSDNYAHPLSYLATVMRKVYAVRNSTYIRYAIQILVVCALRKRKNASATETMPRHNSPNKDQFIFT